MMDMLNYEPDSPKKQAIYTAVEELLHEGCDINELTVSAITKKAGIGKGTAYEYFSSKEDLLSDAVLYILGKTIGELFEQIFRRKTLLERTQYVLQTVDQEIGQKKCCIDFYSLLSGNVVVGSAIRDKIQMCIMENKIPSILECLVQQGVEEGIIRSDIPAKFLAYQALSRIMSYVSYLNMEPDTTKEERQQMQQFICDRMMEDLQSR